MFIRILAYCFFFFSTCWRGPTRPIWEKSKMEKQQIKRHASVAEATFKKDARINIRLSSRDLRSLQARALMEGMPYQTFVSSILHKFIDGKLVDKS